MTLPVAAEAVGDLAQAGAESGASAQGVRTAARSHSVTDRTGVKPTNPRPPRSDARPTPPKSARTGTARKRVAMGGRSLDVPRFSGTGHGGGAHRLVIAEFLACIVLIGIAPILTRPAGNGHLYVANDFLRLSATCLLFFVLALLSNQPKSARFAAAFGALVTLGALFNASQGLTAVANLFTPSTQGGS